MTRERTPANQRDFKGAFIPKEVWCSRDLTGDEKLVWGEIFSLDNDFGCVVSNAHFMEMFGFSNDRKVQRCIKALREKGYISVQIDKRAGSRVMRVLGKYRHLDAKHMASIERLREDLLRNLSL